MHLVIRRGFAAQHNAVGSLEVHQHFVAVHHASLLAIARARKAAHDRVFMVELAAQLCFGERFCTSVRPTPDFPGRAFLPYHNNARNLLTAAPLLTE